MENLTEKLLALYRSKWSPYIDLLREIAENDPAPEPSNPFLICVDEEEQWTKADLKVMVFGQETCGWEGYAGTPAEYLLDLYRRRFHGREWEEGDRRPFFRAFSLLAALLAAKFPDKHIQYLWNNIIKVGRSDEKGRPPVHIYELELEYFCVIPSEVEILRPDVILFFTGPDYDDAIRNNFGAVPQTAIP
ncbi:MAG: hypothetical protein LBP25_06325, partial [Tannerellaceae bacterium]|nr:hypothetical protein [Tannerellaceae bacterium]